MIQDLIRKISAPFRRPPERFATISDLRRFIETRSAYVTQRSMYEYCRARAGTHWQYLVSEKPFVDQMSIKRWMAYPEILGDICVAVEGALRPHAGPKTVALAERIAGLGAETLRATLPTEGPGVEVRHEIDLLIAALRTRIGEAQVAAPLAVHDIARNGGEAIFVNMPIHENMKGVDRTVIHRNVAFLMVRVISDFNAAADHAAIISELGGPAAPRVSVPAT